jgi:ABC-type uncharacterized transport system permease subunit
MIYYPIIIGIIVCIISYIILYKPFFGIDNDFIDSLSSKYGGEKYYGKELKLFIFLLSGFMIGVFGALLSSILFLNK